MRAFLLALAVGLQTPGESPKEREPARGDRLVRVELLADRAALRAGEDFTLAVKLTVEPGWHVYWLNPGDSGMPTSFRFEAPPGITLGEAQFPTPEREVDEGDIVTFVHKGEVVFLFDAHVAKEGNEKAAPGSKAELRLDVSWLVCKETCYPGSGKALLEIPFAEAGSAPAALANEKLVSAARARMSRPWKELEGAAIEWAGAGESRTVRILVPGATRLELFPLASRTTSVEGSAFAAEAKGGRWTGDVRFRELSPGDPPRLQGVLVVRSPRGELSFQMDTTDDRSKAR